MDVKKCKGFFLTLMNCRINRFVTCWSKICFSSFSSKSDNFLSSDGSISLAISSGAEEFWNKTKMECASIPGLKKQLTGELTTRRRKIARPRSMMVPFLLFNRLEMHFNHLNYIYFTDEFVKYDYYLLLILLLVYFFLKNNLNSFHLVFNDFKIIFKKFMI